MKKLLLVLAVLFFATTARAQGFGFCLGPKVGYQTANLSIDKADIKSGFSEHLTLGVFGRISLGNFQIQPEILWFKSGQVFNLDFSDSSISSLNPKLEMTQQNLAIPIYLGYQFVDFKLLKMRANLGPVMYFVLSQDGDCTLGNEDLSLKANKMTWGGAVNVGVDVLFFTLDINYSFGLSNLFDKSSMTISGQEFVFDDTKQSVFTVTLGMKLLSL